MIATSWFREQILYLRAEYRRIFIFNPCTNVHNLLEHNSIMKLECKKSGKGFNRSYIVKIQICDFFDHRVTICDYQNVNTLLPEQVFHNSTSKIDNWSQLIQNGLNSRI